MKFDKIILLGILNGLCLLYILLWFSVTFFAFNMGYYSTLYETNNTYKQMSMEKSELNRVTGHLLEYLQGQRHDLQTEAVIGDSNIPVFNGREIAHMKDVKDIFGVLDFVGKAALFIFLMTLLMFLKRRPLMLLAKTYIWVICSLLGLVLLLYGIISLDFNRAFNFFHEVCFSNDLWLLNPLTDRLINMYPLNFFINMSASIALLFTGFLLLIIVLSLMYLYFYKRKLSDNRRIK